MRISDWSYDLCSSDLQAAGPVGLLHETVAHVVVEDVGPQGSERRLRGEVGDGGVEGVEDIPALLRDLGEVVRTRCAIHGREDDRLEADRAVDGAGAILLGEEEGGADRKSTRLTYRHYGA